MAQIQNRFAPGSVLIAETQLLLFWPFVTYLWSGFFSWTSIWNFDLAFRPLRKPAPPVGSCLGKAAFPTPCKRWVVSPDVFILMLATGPASFTPARLKALSSDAQVSTECARHRDTVLNTCASWPARFPYLPLIPGQLCLIRRQTGWAFSTSARPSCRMKWAAGLSGVPSYFWDYVNNALFIRHHQGMRSSQSEFPRWVKFGVSSFMFSILKAGLLQCSVYHWALLGQRGWS